MKLDFARMAVAGSLLLFISIALAQERCKPLLPADVNETLPCAADIVGGNSRSGMYPPQAIEKARKMLWDRFTHRLPGFLNLQLASKEGELTRFVYVLERISNNENLVLRWAVQRQVMDLRRHTAVWSPIETFRATEVIRDKTTGILTFKTGAQVIGEL